MIVSAWACLIMCTVYDAADKLGAKTRKTAKFYAVASVVCLMADVVTRYAR